MDSVTYIKEVKVMIEDCDGVKIMPGSVLRCIDQDDNTLGVVVSIVNAEDPSSFRMCVGPFGHGDLVIQTGHGTYRVTNRYSRWKHVPHEEQTYDLRFRSWCERKFEFDEYGLGSSPDEQIAIGGILNLLPECPVDYDFGPIPETVEDALALIAAHLDEKNGKADDE